MHDSFPPPFRLGGFSETGTKYLDLNQDRFFTLILKNEFSSTKEQQPYAVLCGVCDGHGELGEQAALIAVQSFEAFLTREIQEKWEAGQLFQNFEESMNRAFEYAHHQIQESYTDVPPTYTYPVGDKKKTFTLEKGEDLWFYRGQKEKRFIEFGTTATVAIIINKTLTVGYVGDSQCAISRVQGGKLITEMLFEKHNAYNPSEIRRIRRDFPNAQFTSDNYLRVIVKKYGEVQLAMTRALGHKLFSEFGVISTPEIKTIHLNSEQVFFVMASDGVWDWMKETEVVDFISDYQNPEEAAQALTKQATELCQFPEIDNTTCVIGFLQ